MNAEQITIILIVLGLIPFRISFRKFGSSSYRKNIQVQAAFWYFTINQPSRRSTHWCLSVPLIRRLIATIWAALKSLIKK